MLRARITVAGGASTVLPAIAPETGRELHRTSTSLSREGEDAVIEVSAEDASAMRAALNSHLECIKVVQDIGSLAQVRP